MDLALRSKVPFPRTGRLPVSGAFPRAPSFPALFHSTDGYATVDRRERRTLGSDSTGETSEKELFKVSDSEQVPREALCLGLGKRTAM